MQARIYLVEDSPQVREWLTASLQDLVGVTVVGSAATEAEACSWLTEHRDAWDITVVDLGLANGSGLRVMGCLEKSAAQKAVVLTNYPTKQMRELCMFAGADAFFDKSTELDEFGEFIEQFLSAPGLAS